MFDRYKLTTLRSILRSLILLSTIVLLALLPRPIHAQATIDVTTPADSVDCGTAPAGSLRAALCGPLNPGDVINIQVPGPIALAANLPTITVAGQGITINGTNPTTTIQGGPNIRVFSILGGTLTLNNLTMTDADCTDALLCTIILSGFGGAIINNGGTLTVNNSTFTGNSAGNGGGISNLGNTTVNNTSFINNTGTNSGGAIHNGGPLVITNSTFTGNSAPDGGAIFNGVGGALTVTNSTFSGNTIPGAAIRGGGAISNIADVLVTNSTFYNNSAVNSNGGSIWNDGTSFVVTNSTFVANTALDGGGIWNGGTINIRNSLIADSPAGGNCSGPSAIATNGAASNLSTDGTCGAGFTGNVATLNLGAFGNNGGPTDTIPLLVGSAAIGQGRRNACPATDQRGVARVRPCSVGAFELPIVPPPSQNSNESSGDSSNQPSLPSSLCFDPSYQSVIGVRAEVPSDLASIDGIPVNLFCVKLINPNEYDVLDRPVSLAVEILALTKSAPNLSVTRLNQSVKVCLQGAGTLLYRDATGIPRVVSDAPNVTFENSYSCTRITNVGTLILVPGPSAAPASANVSETALSDCQITTRNIINLRSGPDSNSSVITRIPYNITLTATARAGAWIKVIFQNGQGYVSADLVDTNGACGG